MDTDLWRRIEAFRFDRPGIALTFAGRLAQDNGWSRPYAERVVAEYRRFLYLCIGAGHPVTPSDQVDQAWHQHLAYTRSYWDDLCGGVLGRPLHHGPTEGGDGEAAKFHDWYDRTLASYTRIFGAEPPADIWPPAETRFSERFVRTKRRQRRNLSSLVAIGSAGAGACLLGAAAARPASPNAVPWDVVVMVLAGIVLIAILIRAARGGGGPGGSGCGGFFGLGCGGGDSGCGHGSGCASGCGSGCGAGCGGGGD